MDQDKNPTDKVKVYLDYLDKEMTIMGILSTFCIVALGFVAEKLLFPDKDAPYRFWKLTPTSCFLGFVGLAGGGFSFYRQRSLLAWYYGQISLFIARNDDEKVSDILVDSDAWYNWRWYQGGFGCLFLAFAELAVACLSSICSFFSKYEVQIDSAILISCIVGTGFFIRAYSKFGYDDEPLWSLWESISKRKKS